MQLYAAAVTISIRAPARGATRVESADANGYNISIRAPARGATVHRESRLFLRTFQSALPRGERRRPHFEIIITLCDFNPRSREGSDVPLSLGTCHVTHFNPRSREGSDMNIAAAPLCHPSFQSALPRGERRSPLFISYISAYISIRAPARGATSIFAKKFSSLLAKIV